MRQVMCVCTCCIAVNWIFVRNFVSDILRRYTGKEVHLVGAWEKFHLQTGGQLAMLGPAMQTRAPPPFLLLCLPVGKEQIQHCWTLSLHHFRILPAFRDSSGPQDLQTGWAGVSKHKVCGAVTGRHEKGRWASLKAHRNTKCINDTASGVQGLFVPSAPGLVA
jgi:hypothetical protein